MTLQSTANHSSFVKYFQYSDMYYSGMNESNTDVSTKPIQFLQQSNGNQENHIGLYATPVATLQSEENSCHKF